VRVVDDRYGVAWCGGFPAGGGRRVEHFVEDIDLVYVGGNGDRDGFVFERCYCFGFVWTCVV